MRVKQNDVVYLEGQAWRAMGGDVTYNPYINGSRAWIEWLEGWCTQNAATRFAAEQKVDKTLSS